MSLKPHNVDVYHVFLASPGDVSVERQHVRRFFDDYNRSTAHLWGAEFKVIDWENYSTIGVGRPQELITQQTLEKFKGSLALVVGIMAQRFGSPSGKAESGTEEEFNWAKQTRDATGDFPEIKWFFRKIDKLEMPADPDEADLALDQWKKVRAFRKKMQDLNDPIFYAEYPSSTDFAKVFDHDYDVRSAALQSLAAKWSDDCTRELLRTRAVEDQHESVRGAALQSLAAKWPDDSTRELLRARAVEDQDANVREVACSVLGGMHSEFGRNVWTRDLNGYGSCRVPLLPLSSAHIQKAAAKAGIAAGDLEAQIVSLNQHLGWDIRVGAKP